GPSIPLPPRPSASTRKQQTVTGRTGLATIAVANMQSQHDKTANLDKILRFIEEASLHGAEFLVLPECALQGYPYGTGSHDADEFAYQYEHAETVPGPSTDRVVEAAREHEMVVALGLTELAGSLGPAGLL